MIDSDITEINKVLSEKEKSAKNFKFEKNLKDKKSIINERFLEIEKSYENSCLSKRIDKKPEKFYIENFRDNLHKIVKYTKLDCLAQFQFNPHVTQTTNI